MPNPVRYQRLWASGRRRRAPGMPGHAASFVVASQQSLTVASNASLQMAATDFAFAGWVKLTDTANYRIIASKEQGDGSQPNMEYELRINPGVRPEWIISNGANYFVQSYSSLVSTGVWFFIYAEFNSATTTLGLRINGSAMETQATGGGTPQASTGAFGLGFDPRAGGSFGMNGSIDGAGLWKRRLTAGEQGQIYNGGSGIRLSETAALWGSLVSGWELDDSGATWYDWFGTNHLVNNNGTTSVAGLTP